MCGASVQRGDADRDGHRHRHRRSIRRVAGLALLACLVLTLLKGADPGLVDLGGSLEPIGPGLVVGLAASGGADRDSALERLATEIESCADRLERRPEERGGEGGSRNAIRNGTAFDADAESGEDRDRAPDRLREREHERPIGGVGTDIDVDVDGLRERDDEIGRLSAAVDDLTTAVRERERRLADHERYRRDLYRIAATPETGSEETIRRLLELGCDRLGVEAGFVSRIDESDRHEVRIASGPGSSADAEGGEGAGSAASTGNTGNAIVRDGDEPAPAARYCRETVAADGVLAVSDTAAGDDADTAAGDDADTAAGDEADTAATGDEADTAATGDEADPDARERESDVGCYLGGTIEVDSEPYGALCFVDREPRDEPFSELETAFVELATQCASRELQRRGRERRLERYRAFTDDVLDAVDDIVYVLDADGGLRRWNETLAEVTGYDDAELEGKNALEFFDDASRDAIETAIGDVSERGAARAEGDLVTSDGERIPYEFIASALEDPDGETVIAGVGRDISERTEKERQLEEYTAFTDDIFDAIDDIFYVLDEDGELRRWNETLVDVTGYSHAEIEAMERPLYFDEDAMERIWDSVAEVFETGETRVEVPVTTKDGERIPYEFVANRLEDPDGNPVEVGLGRDISERKRYERDLERTTQLLGQAQRLSNVGGWEFDVRGAEPEIQWTDETARIHGLDPDADIDADLEDAIEFYHPDDRPRVRRAVERAIEAGDAYDLEVRFITAQDEQRWVRTIGEPVAENGTVVTVRGSIQDITERKERERAVQETSERLGAIIEASPAAIVALDTDGTVEQWNAAAEDIFGWREDEVVGERPPFVPDDRLDEFEALRERLLAGGSLAGIETERETSAGERIDVSLSAAPMHDADGEVIGIIGVLEDITERKERERRLETTTARLEALFDDSPDIIDVLDSEGTIVEANRRLQSALGYEEDELIGTKIWEHEELFDADEVLALLSELSVGERRKFEGRFRRRDGSTFPIEVHLIRLGLEHDADENRFMAICRDITDRKVRERDLRETKRRLELALEGSSTGIWEWNLETDEIGWNETLERMLGLEPGEFEETYEDFTRRVHPDDVARIERALERAVERDEPYQAEFRMRHEDGDWVWFVARGRLVDGADVAAERAESGEGRAGARMLGIVNDITQRKEHEQQLRERERQLQRYTAYTDDVLDAIDDVFYVLDDDYRLQRWNASFAAVTGYDGAELEGRSALEFIAAEDRRSVRTGLDNIGDLRGVPLEADVVTRDGERLPFEFVAAPLEDPEGNPVIAGIGRDISERIEKERQLSRLIGNVPGLVYRAENEPGWPIEFVSEGVRDIAGYEPGALERGEVRWRTDVDLGEGTWDQVQRALEERESYNLVYPIETADGERRWVKEQGRGVYADDGSVEEIEGVIIDITERIEYERELERTTDLLERVQRMAEVGGWEIDMETEPRTAIWSDELYRLHGLPRDVDPDLETTVECYHPDDRPFVRNKLEAAIAAESAYEFEARLQTGSGETKWVRAMGEPIYDDDGTLVKYRGSVQNITDQKERERALESLNETARGLLNSETERTVAELVVETAGELLEDGSAVVYALDDETNRFEPVASGDEFGAGIDELPSVAVGDNDSLLWNTYVAGTQTVVDNGAIDEEAPLFGADAAGGLLVPIGDHGVFVVDAPPAAIDDETRQLFETLVATTEAAFDRLESEANLRERDAELEARNRRLRRQIGINELIRRIDQSLIGAASRTEIERTVPERLVESDDVAFAWIGTVDPSGTTLEPRTWAGDGGEYLDAVSLALDGAGDDGAEPAVRTAAAEEPTIVENVVDSFQQEAWRTDALTAGFQSVVAVPLVFEEYTYGVLAVYADEPGAFTDLEQTVLTELGESIANAINAVKTREALHAETFVELTLELPAGDDILSRIATTTGARVTYEGLGTASADETVLFFEAAGADSDAVATTLENLVAVTDYRLIRESEEGSLFEATVAGDVVASRLVRHGGSPRSIAADGDRATVTVDVPTGTDVREFVEMLGDHYAAVELRSQRHVERETQTRQELVSTLFEPLTDRQLEVLRTAYFAGFFEWPRESTGEEIAEMLDVTQPTVNRHLRIGQQRLLTQLFESEPPAVADDS